MLNKLYQYIRAFSLDVVAGAAISARWVGNYFKVDIPSEALLALSITVWLIYTLDHLLDARKVEPQKAFLRHVLHHKNAPLLFAMVAMMSVVLIFTVQYLSTELFWQGMLLGAIVIGYLFFVHLRKKPYWGKEWFIAIVYASGICLPTQAYLGEFSVDLLYFWLQFFFLASINLLIFNMFEYKSDKQFGFSSFATVKGHDYTRRVILVLFVLFVIGWSISFYVIKSSDFLDYQAMLIFMGSVLAMVLSKETILREEEWYRVIGDIVFVLPLIEILATSD
ncbi:hypothetical protein GCM10027429_00620 [Marivirga atlantica]|jgi:hypothetical protein|uniref:Prenyltransferase n=1 Tax=Marivirga atlantica TaxID=1548457 RepID=A0A937ADJ8_9BACT|nr:hypothetical protein [Marivirga atlantica]MBL0763674.1 hypothetical protein [Marivirga atlantica]